MHSSNYSLRPKIYQHEDLKYIISICDSVCSSSLNSIRGKHPLLFGLFFELICI